MKWQIGCSGFSYKEWKEAFYPKGLSQRKWFDFYSQHFSTLELNVSFYRFPTVALLHNWYEKTTPGFSFSVKAPRLITHFKQLKDCKRYLSDFYTACRDGLKEKLGPVLFQFLPAFIYTEERLQRIINTLDPAFLNVVEFRESGWWNKKVYAALKKKGIIFCSQSFPGLPDTVIQTAPIAYYRFHGIPKLYFSVYTQKYLQGIADQFHALKKTKEVYCYFNNTATIGAIKNARWISNHLGG